MKALIIFLSFLCIAEMQAKVTKQAVVQSSTLGYQKGDTVKVYGIYNKANGKKKYMVWHSDYQSYRNANIKYLRLLESDLNFWDELYFNERAAEEIRKKPSKNLYGELKKKESRVLTFAKENYLLSENEILEDYLRGLMMKVYAAGNDGEIQNTPKVYLLDYNKPLKATYGSDTYFITTGYLTQQENEEGLLKGLIALKVHNVLQHDLINLQHKEKDDAVTQAVCCLLSAGLLVAIIASAANDTDDGYDGYEEYETVEYEEVYYADNNPADEYISVGLENIMLPVGKKYTATQKLEASKQAQKFIDNKMIHQVSRSKTEYYKTIGGAITKKAWMHFHAMEYELALQEVERLFKEGVATEEDYLLKCKLCRMKYASDEKMYEVLGLIDEAKAIGVNPLIDFDKEAALVYARLGDKENELKSYEQYQKGLMALKNKGEEVGDELSEVKEIIYKLRLP